MTWLQLKEEELAVTSQFPVLSRRRRLWIIAVGAVLGLLLLVAGTVLVVRYAISGPKAKPAVAQPMPQVPQETLSDNGLNQVKSVLGPFSVLNLDATNPAPETHSPAMLILNEDGSTLASQSWTVPFDSTKWKQSGDPFQVRSKTVQSGYVVIGTNIRRTYVVGVNQPFIFAGDPETVYVVDAQGRFWFIATTPAEASRQALNK